MADLMDNINERFLVCKYCNEPYKTPKVLTCLHVFCSVCIQDISDNQNNHGCRYKKPLSCYVCRKKTTLPVGGVKNLPDSMTIINLAATIGRGRVKDYHSNMKCEICQRSKCAESKCSDCCKVLCKSCVTDHRKCRVTASHCIFDLNKENSVARLNCGLHRDEAVKYFCENCSSCICVICTFDKHKDHKIIDFREALKGKNDELNKLSLMCKEKLLRTKGQLDAIKQCGKQIEEAESCIRYMAIESIAEIRRNEKALLGDLHDLYGQETVEILKKSEQLNKNFKKMQNHSESNDKYLGTDELLIVQNDIKLKMNDVISGLDVDIPITMSRKVKVHPVIVKPGQLEEDKDDEIKVVPTLSVIDANDNNIKCDTSYSVESANQEFNITKENDKVAKVTVVTSYSTSATQTEQIVTPQEKNKIHKVSTRSIGCNTRVPVTTGTKKEDSPATTPEQDDKSTLTDVLMISDAYTSMETVDITQAYIQALNGDSNPVSNIHRNSITSAAFCGTKPLAPPRKHRIDIPAVLRNKKSSRSKNSTSTTIEKSTSDDIPIMQLGKKSL